MSNEFYINQAELPEKGRELHVTRSADWLSEIFRDGIYKSLGDVTISGIFRPVGTSVSMDLSLSVSMMFHCSRCGDENNFVYDTGIKHLFTTGSSNAVDMPITLARSLDSELDITEIKSKKFDAEPTIIENFAGDLSIYPVCTKECQAEALTNPIAKSEGALDVPIDPRLAPLLALREKMENVSNESESLS